MVLDELRRGVVRVHILHHASEGEVDGAWLAAELSRHGHRISPGTLYPALHRMEEAGLLVSDRRSVEGKVHRFYTATASGRRELAAARRILTELVGEVLP
ncbi:MAG TPA: PadR family transcriptional regulator [Acidimicrobiia bacterium]|jgi:DNA-binding PadR family transcriptional regulator